MHPFTGLVLVTGSLRSFKSGPIVYTTFFDVPVAENALIM